MSTRVVSRDHIAWRTSVLKGLACSRVSRLPSADTRHVSRLAPSRRLSGRDWAWDRSHAGILLARLQVCPRFGFLPRERSTDHRMVTCRELQRAGLGLWRGDDVTTMVEDDSPMYIDLGVGGLFPSPDTPDSDGEAGKVKSKRFRFLGRFLAKALQDGRLLDLPLSVPFCKILVQQPLVLGDVALVDPVLGRFLIELHDMATGQAPGDKLAKHLEALDLSFTLPGFDQ
jgi:hypothetical protein